MYDIITVGSATVDVFAKTNFSELIKIVDSKGETDLLAYPAGSKILVNEIDITTGGGGTNTAVALSRLGHKVGWLGKVGSDCNASIIISELKREKVDILAVKGKGYSGYSVILDSIEHDRTILAYKGINDDLHFNDVPLKKLKTKWFYFSSMLNESFKTQKRLAKFAEKKGIKIAFNASSYLVELGAEYLKDILKRTDIFVLNKEEAECLVKDGDIKGLLRKVHGLGPKIVAITNGKKGAYAFDGNYVYSIKPSKIKVVETTGAGDAFASSFLSGMIKKNDIRFAMQLGQANAESVIQFHGAKNKLLKYKEALAIIKERHERVKRECYGNQMQ